MVKFEAPIQREGLNNSDWSDDENRQWDTWVNSGTKTAAQATADIENARNRSREAGAVNGTDDLSAESGPEPLQPAPPRPGETDEQIRQRHRDALRARSDSESQAQ